MPKFYGAIGFAVPKQLAPGVWGEEIVERWYYGDLTKNTRRIKGGAKVNDDVTISNALSIVSDPFANENFHSIRYAELMGAKWRIEEVEAQYPRLFLTIGGVYNAEPLGTSEDP